MKHLIPAVLIFSICYVLADPSLYSNPIDYYNVLNGYSNYGAGDRWVCDDFELTDDCYISVIYIWMLFTGQMTDTIHFQILADDSGDSDPNTCSVVWAETVPCDLLYEVPWNIGEDYFTVRCSIDTNNWPQLTAGTHYYISNQAPIVDNCFVLVGHNYIGDYCWSDDGSGEYVRSDEYFGQDSDMYLILYGEPVSNFRAPDIG